MKKLILIATVLALVLCMLTSCFSTDAPIEFKVGRFSIQLESVFKAVSSDYTACFVSASVTVYVLQEKFQDEEGNQILSAELTLEEYGQKVLAANELTDIELEIDEKKGSFVYQDKEGDRIFRVYFYAALDSFWMVQFVTESGAYESQIEKISSWADSVKVG